jgi:hypothetical protein
MAKKIISDAEMAALEASAASTPATPKKIISDADMAALETPAETPIERANKAPTSVASALMDGISGLQQMREANIIKGKDVNERVKQAMAADPNLNYADAYSQQGVDIAPMGPTALTSGVAAFMAPKLASMGRAIAGWGTKAAGATARATKTAVVNPLTLAATGGGIGNYIANKMFGQ